MGRRLAGHLYNQHNLKHEPVVIQTGASAKGFRLEKGWQTVVSTEADLTKWMGAPVVELDMGYIDLRRCCDPHIRSWRLRTKEQLEHEVYVRYDLVMRTCLYLNLINVEPYDWSSYSPARYSTFRIC